MRLLSSGYVRQATTVYFFQGITVVAAFVGSIVLARALGPTGKGTVDLFLLLLTIVVEVALLGISSGFLYQLANIKRPFHHIHGDAIAAAAAVGLLGVLLALAAPSFFAELVGDLPVAYAAVALAAAGFFAYAASWTNLMLGLDRAGLMHRIQAAVAVASASAALLLWWLGRLTVDTAIVTVVAIGVSAALVRLGIARRFHVGIRPAPTAESFRASFVYGIRTFPGTLANWLHFRVDQIVIAHVLGVAGVGVYSVSVRWAELLWIVGIGLLHAGVYRVASSSTVDSYELSKRIFWATVVLAGAAGGVLAILAPALLEALYGSEFAGAVVPLLLLIPGVVAWDAARVLSNHISYNRGRPVIPTTIAIVGALMNLAGTLYAVPRWGLSGAAAASSLSYFFVLGAVVIVFWTMGRNREPARGFGH